MMMVTEAVVVAWQWAIAGWRWWLMVTHSCSHEESWKWRTQRLSTNYHLLSLSLCIPLILLILERGSKCTHTHTLSWITYYFIWVASFYSFAGGFHYNYYSVRSTGLPSLNWAKKYSSIAKLGSHRSHHHHHSACNCNSITIIV